MKLGTTLLILLTFAAIFDGPDALGPSVSVPHAQQQLSLHAERSSLQDLKISGKLPAGFSGDDGFVPYNELLKLPLITFSVTDDANFPSNTQITGVYLDELLKALGFVGQRQMISAAGSDDYEAHFTAEYREAHQPLLVLRINGRGPEAWPTSAHGGESYRPYVISHMKFTPAFHVLSHTDEPQIPYGVVELKFWNEEDVLHALRPPGKYALESPEVLGGRIAFQNCLRCHNMGTFGGHKGYSTWNTLAEDAVRAPAAFAELIRNPAARNPATEMPGNPQYDAQTLQALTAYFQAFSHKEKL